MSQPDLSSPQHRLDNISRGLLYRVYATIFALVHKEELANNPISDLRVMFDVANVDLAQKFDVLPSTWVNRLFEVGDPYRYDKDAEDEAGFPSV